MNFTRALRLSALFFFGTALAVPLAFAEVVVPDAPDGYVLDQAEILSEATEAQLQIDLAALQATNSSQLVVVTITDLQGYEPEQYALEILRQWGVGQEEFNNGLVFLIVPTAQVSRIEVGYGLEGAITDAQSFLILNKVAIPYFQTGNYDQGVLEAMTVLETLAKGEVYDLSGLESQPSGEDILSLFLFFGLPILWGLASLFSGTKSWWLGGVFGGIFGALTAGATGFLLGVLTGLFVDYILSTYFFGKLISAGGTGGVGGIFFGGGRGGSGGGGFGGFGGGSGGGGGAGMRW